MKATIDVPDELYRQVKSKSALQAQTVREVTVSLYRNWLASPVVDRTAHLPKKNSPPPAWFASARRYAERCDTHDLDSVRESIAQGRQTTEGEL
jgi:hypothetical protein